MVTHDLNITPSPNVMCLHFDPWHYNRYIEKERAHFELFIEDDESFDEYLSRLKSNGEWGGNAEVFAAAQLYRADISIFQVPFITQHHGHLFL